jgi:hypothetical protein
MRPGRLAAAVPDSFRDSADQGGLPLPGAVFDDVAERPYGQQHGYGQGEVAGMPWRGADGQGPCGTFGERCQSGQQVPRKFYGSTLRPAWHVTSRCHRRFTFEAVSLASACLACYPRIRGCDDAVMEDRHPALNPDFPACAYAARRMLAEVYGCKPGDMIPGEAELIARARQVEGSDDGKASYALAMVEEIGGLFA